MTQAHQEHRGDRVGATEMTRRGGDNERAGGRMREGAVAVLVAALIAAARLQPLHNPDVLWQIRTGDAILAQKARVTSDLFTLALRGRPIHDHEPAFEVLASLVDRAGGLGLLWWVNLVAAIAAAVIAVHAARRFVDDAPARVVAAALAFTAIAPRFELRAEAASFLAIAVAHAIRRDGNGRTARVLAPIAAAACAAPFHGLALLTAIVPGVHALEGLTVVRTRGWRPIFVDVAVAFGCVAVAEAIVPGMIRNVFANAQGAAFAEHIIEGYSPLKFTQMSGDPTPFLALGAALVGAMGLVRLVREGRAHLADVLLVALLAIPGLRWVRFAPMPVLAAMPWVVAGVARLVEPLTRRMGRALAAGLSALAVGVGALVVTSYLGFSGIGGFDWRGQPVEAVAWLREHRPDASVFHPYNFGAYLIYAHYPARGVVIDPRAATVYPDVYARRYYDALTQPAQFEQWVETAPFDTVLLQRRHMGTSILRAHLLFSPRWKVAYEDPLSIVFFKR